MKKRNWFFILQMIPIYAATIIWVLLCIAAAYSSLSELWDALFGVHLCIALFSGVTIGVAGLFVASAYKQELKKERDLTIAMSIVDILISVGALFLAFIVWVGRTF